MNVKSDKAKVSMKFKGFVNIDGDKTTFDIGFDLNLEVEHIDREVVLDHLTAAVLKAGRNKMRNGRAHLATESKH